MVVRKLPSGQYRLYSKSKHGGKRRNLGTFPTKRKALIHEGQVQALKRKAKK